MACKMTKLTDKVRVGVPGFDDADATMEEIFVPADAASELGKFLLLKS